MVSEYESNKIDWLKRIDWLEVNNSMIDNTQRKLAERFKKEPSFNDICWSILNNLLIKHVNDLEKQRSTYFEMARILELEGKDNKEIIVKANRIELLESKKRGDKFVSTTTCNDNYVCDNCKKMEQEKIPIDVALETNPIPYRCTNNKCRCSYLIIISYENTYTN